MNTTARSFEILDRPEPKRFHLDDRIIMLDHPDQFALHRGFVGGLLCPYDPFTKEDDALIMEFAKSIVTGQPDKSVRYEGNPVPLWQINPYLDSCPQPLRQAFKTAVDGFHDVHPRHFNTYSIRINSTAPHIFHNHSTSMTYTIFGEGTEVIGEDGIPYHVPARHIFVFDHDIHHRASQRVSMNDIRISFLAG